MTVYSNSISGGRGERLTKKATEAGFNLSFVGLGGGDIANHLLAEASNPIVSVVFGFNNMYFREPGRFRGPRGVHVLWCGDGATFWPIVRELVMLGYSTESYPGLPRPPPTGRTCGRIPRSAGPTRPSAASALPLPRGAW